AHRGRALRRALRRAGGGPGGLAAGRGRGERPGPRRGPGHRDLGVMTSGRRGVGLGAAGTSDGPEVTPAGDSDGRPRQGRPAERARASAERIEEDEPEDDDEERARDQHAPDQHAGPTLGGVGPGAQALADEPGREEEVDQRHEEQDGEGEEAHAPIPSRSAAPFTLRGSLHSPWRRGTVPRPLPVAGRSREDRPMPHPQMFDDDDPWLERVRTIALALPGAQEKGSHGRPAFHTVKVHCYYGGSRKVDGQWEEHPQAVLLHLPPRERAALAEEARSFVPAYLGPSG